MAGRLGFPVLRDARHRFKGPDDYLRQASEHGQFCQAVAKVSRGPETPGNDRDGADQSTADVWKGFPWVTPVIGSGALELPVRLGFDAKSLADAVAARLEEVGLEEVKDSQGESLPSLARTFTESLVTDRLQATSKVGDDVGDRYPVDLLPARLALIAALGTRFFHLVRAFGPSSISRSGTEVATWDSMSSSSAAREPLDTIGVDVLEPLAGELTAAMKLLKQHPSGEVTRAVTGFLDEVKDRLDPRDDDPRSLDLDDLRLLTEVAWFFLIQGTQVYPGWSDLLLGLMLHQKHDAPLRSSRRPRPKFKNLMTLAESVATLMKEATEASWDTLAAGSQPDERDRFFAATAEVLWSQANARTTQNKLPPAVGFVTSFDLELEMALWVQARTGDHFSVAIPVHILLGRNSTVAEPFWLIGSVTREMEVTDHAKQLEKLQRPSWRVLSASPRDDDPLFQGPVVVHLSGCPLFDLSEVNGSSGASIRSELLEILELPKFGDEVLVTHAVTVDEYLALRQSATELFSASQHEKDPAARRGRGLPVALTKSTTRNMRFWMALGVAVADPAIRHRLVSQISIQWLRGSGDKRTSEPIDSAEDADDSGLGRRKRRSDREAEDITDVHGVAVNRRIDDEEASLLYWLGLDVVEADCQEFVPHLRHYSWHVEKGNPMSSVIRCPVAPR